VGCAAGVRREGMRETSSPREREKREAQLRVENEKVREKGGNEKPQGVGDTRKRKGEGEMRSPRERVK